MDAHIRDLRYFVAVAEELSFTKAAERLFISQPALSKQIRHLENTVRVRLFERDRRTVALTPAGAELLPRARQLVERWEEAVRAVEAVASGLGVTLLAAGNAEIYQREGVTCRPVSGLPPSELAVAWRTADNRPAIRVFVESCASCLCVTPPPTPAPAR
jgi:DNA-binding transcriptional LysR family regulator